MELLHPWVDLECMKHNNKKSIKPKKEEKEEKDDFLNELLEDALYSKFPIKSVEWAKENLDLEWLKDFISETQKLKESFTKDPPNYSELILLKYIFLLRKGF